MGAHRFYIATIVYLCLFSTVCATEEEDIIPGRSNKQGSFGTALSLNGIDDYLTIPDTKSISLVNDFTIEIWIRAKILTNTYNMLWSKANTLINQTESSPILNGIYAYIDPFNSHLHIAIGDGVRQQLILCNKQTSPDVIRRIFFAGTWIHVAVTWNKKNQNLVAYQDGVLIVDESDIFRPEIITSEDPETRDPTIPIQREEYTSVINTKGSPFYIGSHAGLPETMFAGDIDEFRVWRKTKPGWAIQHGGERQIKERNFGVDLVAYYQMNEGQGMTALDKVTKERNKKQMEAEKSGKKAGKKIKTKQARFRGSTLTKGKSWITHQTLGWSAIRRDKVDTDGHQCYLFNALGGTVIDVTPTGLQSTLTEFTYYCRDPDVPVHLVTLRPFFYESVSQDETKCDTCLAYNVVNKTVHQCKSVGVHRIVLRAAERWALQLDDVIGVCFTMDIANRKEGTIPWEASEIPNYRAVMRGMPVVGEKIVFSWPVNRTFSVNAHYVIGTFPSAPTMEHAEPIDHGAIVHFKPATHAGSARSGITHYIVYSHPEAITATGTTSPITITGLNSSIEYHFTVSAVSSNGAGDESELSNSIKPLTEVETWAAGLPAIPKITWDNGENLCLLFNNTYGIFVNDTIISSFDIYFHQIGHQVRLQTWRPQPWEKPDPSTLPDKPVEPKIKLLGQNTYDNFHYKGKEWGYHYRGPMLNEVCRFQLIGEYRIVPTKEGLNHIVVPKEKRWETQKGDVLGMCHQYKGAVRWGFRPYQRTLTAYIKTNFPRVGDILTFNEANRRAFAMQANRVVGDGEEPFYPTITDTDHGGLPEDDMIAEAKRRGEILTYEMIRAAAKQVEAAAASTSTETTGTPALESAGTTSTDATSTPSPDTVVEVEIPATPDHQGQA